MSSDVGRAQVPETDVSEVLDFRRIAGDGGFAVAGVSRVEGYDWPVYKLDKQPGKRCRNSMLCFEGLMALCSWVYHFCCLDVAGVETLHCSMLDSFCL
jgi:hypothetical protein